MNKKEKNMVIHSMVKSLLTALKLKDPITYDHCLRVAKSVQILCKELGLDLHDQQRAYLAGLVHDIGKIGVPQNILDKREALNSDEYSIVKKHPYMSLSLIKPFGHIPLIKSIFNAVLHHHERFDGKGYPDQIKGEKIPYIARVLTVIDAFDAMTNNRPYHKSITIEAASRELAACAGSQFDPGVTEIFLNSSCPELKVVA